MSETKEPLVEKKELSKKLSFNSELIFFKNELLGDLKQIEYKFAKKLGDQKDDTQNQLMEIHNKIDTITKKIFNISNEISKNKFDEEKIESLQKFSKKMEDTINLHEIKMKSISMDLVNAINKYDRIIEKNLFYPGIIGADNARFNTLHNFIDFVLKNIEQLNTFKEQAIGFDFERYKKKLNSMMEGLRKQADQILTHGRLFTIQYMENLEKKFKSDFDLFDQKLFDIKIKNAEQYNDFDRIIKEYEKTATITNLQIKEFLKQYNDINRKFDLIIEFLKDVKSGKGSHMNFNEFISYKNSQEFYKKKPNVESYLKKYIGGLLGMDEISKLSRKHRYAEENTNNTNINNNTNNTGNNTNIIKKFLRKKTQNIVTPNKPISNNPVFLNNNPINPKVSLSKSISQNILIANKMNNNLKDNLKKNYMNNSKEKIVKEEKMKLSSSIKRNDMLNINKKNVENSGSIKEKSFKEKSQENILDEITETITNNNSINEENKNENKNETNKIENTKIENTKIDYKEKEIKIKISPQKQEKKEEQKISKEKRSPSNKSNKSNKEEDKKDKLMNNIKLEKRINDNVDDKKNNNIIKNIIKMPDIKKDNNNINNNYNFNVILEHNENEEKEYELESDLDTQIKLNNQKIANLMDKENNTNLNDFDNNSNNLDLLKNELLYELQDKRIPNTNKNNIIYNEKSIINNNNKNNLHKLLTGDKNALRYFKIINNGQEIDLSNMTIKDKNRNNFGTFNLNNRNMQYFDNIVQNKNIEDNNFYNTINSGFYINGGKNRNNNNYKSKKIDITRSVSTNYKSNRNKPKLKIVNLPEIPSSLNKEEDYQRTDDYFYEADSHRNGIGKFNYNYDLYGKGTTPFKTNIRNMSPNNVKLRAYDGFI